MTKRSIIAVVEGAKREELPALIGQLEAAKAQAWARLTTPAPAPAPVAAALLPKHVSVREAAETLGMSREFLYHSPLPFVRRFGRRVLVDVAGAERWLRTRTST